MEGEKEAWQEIANRLDGKPAQVITGEDGPLIPASISVTFVKPGQI